MKRFVVPRDYPDLADRMHIYLVNAGDRASQGYGREVVGGG